MIKKVPLIYLAGGMRSNWQDEVKKAVPGVSFIDPRNHPFTGENDYTSWDLSMLEKCDILFAFLEKSNPGGQGLCVEAGFACKMGITVIFVEELDRPDYKYMGMVRAISSYYANDLQKGISLLQQAVAMASTHN